MTWKQARGMFFEYGGYLFVGLLLVVIIVLAYAYCGGPSNDEKGNQIQSNTDEKKGEATVINGLVVNQNGVVTNAAKNTNQAVNDLHNSVNRPSNSFDSNRANDRFCRDFPADPSCK